jgi:hypothetical protein
MNADDAARWEAEKRAILVALFDLGESFLPESDAPEIVERRQEFAKERTQVERLPAIPDWSMVRNLYRSVVLFAEGLRQAVEVGRDSLDYAEEIETVLSAKDRGEARGFTERQIRTTVQTLRQRLDKLPTRVLVATELNTSEATLKRALKDLGMGPWPPAPPED